MNGAHGDRSHVEHSPSSAYRWTACPGSINLCRRVPPAPTSVYAEEGTAAHELAHYCLDTSNLKRAHNPMDFINQEWNDEERDAEFCQAVQLYVDYVRELQKHAQWSFVERWFHLDALNPPAQMSGTSDFCSITGTLLEVVDYKHGKGVPVEVENNPQLRYYALGALISLPEEVVAKVQRVRITVVQPRAYNEKGSIRSEELSVMALLDFTMELFAAVEATQEDQAMLVPGEHCRFCAAHAVCPALREKALELAHGEFFSVTPEPAPQPSALTEAQIGELMSRFRLVEDWMAAVREYAFNTMSNGTPIPGWKLVPKRANRSWKDEAAVFAWARKQKIKPATIQEVKLFSPAQMEKHLGKDKVPADLIQSISSGLTIAEATDPRSPVNLLAPGEEFAAITQ